MRLIFQFRKEVVKPCRKVRSGHICEKSLLDETDDAKRALDIVGSMVGMVILGIATIFVAPAIKLDSPGPVFFGQTRVGKNGRKFTFYKFRSMYKDAEARKKS